MDSGFWVLCLLSKQCINACHQQSNLLFHKYHVKQDVAIINVLCILHNYVAFPFLIHDHEAEDIYFQQHCNLNNEEISCSQ